MHVALNALLLSTEQSYRSGGISRVIFNLLAELARDPRGHRFDAFVSDPPPFGSELDHGGVRFHASDFPTQRPTTRIAWEQTALPRRLAQLEPDLLHGLAYALPLAWKGPSVLTIYDLSFLRYPRAFNTANRIYLAATTRAAARRARRVLTISEHARRDIVRLLRVPEQRVDVTYPAADERYRLIARDRGRRLPQSTRPARCVHFRVGYARATQEPGRTARGLRAAACAAAAALRGRWRGLAYESHFRHSDTPSTRVGRTLPGLRTRR